MSVLKLHANINQGVWMEVLCNWKAFTCPPLCSPATLVLQCVIQILWSDRRCGPPTQTIQTSVNAIDYQLHCKKTHHTSFTALGWLQQCTLGKGGPSWQPCIHRQLPPSNHRWLLLRSVCKKTKTRNKSRWRSIGVETTEEAQYTEQCLGSISHICLLLHLPTSSEPKAVSISNQTGFFVSNCTKRHN